MWTAVLYQCGMKCTLQYSVVDSDRTILYQICHISLLCTSVVDCVVDLCCVLYSAVPQAVCWAAGVVFLVLGFISLCQIRTIIIKTGGTKTDKFEKLMVLHSPTYSHSHSLLALSFLVSVHYYGL